MKCHILNVRYESCCTCDKMSKCSVFGSLTDKQRDAYMEFIQDSIRRHPDKYTLGVEMAAEKVTRNIIVLPTKPLPDSWKTMDDINKMSDEEKMKLKDMEIYQVAKKYKVYYKVELKSVPLDNDPAPTPKKAKK